MLNNVTLMGRLGKDPELRHTQTGRAVASFSLAVDRDYKSQGSDQRETDWFDCVAWGPQAEFCQKYFSKGRTMILKGRLQVRSWTDQHGNKRRSTEVVAESIYFGDSKRDSGSGSYAPPGDSYNAPPGEFADLSEMDDNDLPF